METKLKESVDSLKQEGERRISRSATILLDATINNVFPLFGPIREKEWAEGWDPEILFSNNNLVEDGMIFRTKGEEENYLWVVSKYIPEKYLVEYTVHTSQRIWFIKVVCRPEGERTSATVTYTYTGLTSEGIRLNRSAITKMYEFDLNDWEHAINHYLKTGSKQITYKP